MERKQVADEIRKLVRLFKAHPWDINCGRCEDFADALVEALGEGAESFWVVDLPDYHLARDEHDIAHAVVLYQGWYYDAEEVYGVRDWRHLPLCARVLREIQENVENADIVHPVSQPLREPC